jgi:hypothetical protein
MKTVLRLAIFGLFLICCASVFAQKPDFNGSWTMDRARSFGLPGNMNQTMAITQTANELTVETKLIQPGNERTVKDSYVLDGKEYDFTPQAPPGQPVPKGKRTATWMAGGNGLLITNVVTTESPKGPVTTQDVRKWTIINGELVIAQYVDSPNVSYEAKRIFKKNP